MRPATLLLLPVVLWLGVGRREACASRPARRFPFADVVPPCPIYRFEPAGLGTGRCPSTVPAAAPFVERDVSAWKDLRVTAITVEARAGWFTVRERAMAPRRFTIGEETARRALPWRDDASAGRQTWGAATAPGW
jgi:hypothetical protein